MVVHASNELGRQRQMDIYKFNTNLVYLVISAGHQGSVVSLFQ